MAVNLLENVLRLLLPPTCILCGSSSAGELDLCVACAQDLPWLGPHCSYCAYPLPEGQPLCGACLKLTLAFELRTQVLFTYQFPVSRLVVGLKFNNKLRYARVLGTLLARNLESYYHLTKQAKPEVVIPIPLHPKRLQERGYNQALELADPIARRLALSIDQVSVVRTKHTTAQTLLGPVERLTNLRGAFAVNWPPGGGYTHVAVVDDVLTTGATALEFCRELARHGVRKIELWCCAKTLP